ncbi:MAG: hypothetical protein WCC12_17145, partial [Anaerolineales bacterium]
MKKAYRLLFLGLFLLTACSPGMESTAAPTASPQPTATALPTPSAPGGAIVWRDLQVSMDRAEITDSFVTEFGTQRLPTGDNRFLWIHVRLENVGAGEIRLPVSENFSVLYAETEIKPVYGHRQGYADYTDVGSPLFPWQE